MLSELKHETRDVPGNALQFFIQGFELGDNGDGAKTAPIRLLARAGKPIEHPYWGSVVHDFEGMQHKSRIPIDYRHDEPIGYVNKFDSSTGDLVLSGALVPFKDSDKATEIIHKSQAGVPYEASIDFRAPVVMEELDRGQFAEVNGNRVDGPATIIRQWTLRGVAVCPYGADANTSSQLSSAEMFSVSVTKSEASMPKDQEPVVTAEPAALEVATANQFTAADALKAFGTDGAVWFAEGKSQTEMQSLHAAKEVDWKKSIAEQLATATKASDEKIAELEQRLAALASAGGSGEEKPVTFGSGEAKDQKRRGFASRFENNPLLLAGAKAASASS